MTDFMAFQQNLKTGEAEFNVDWVYNHPRLFVELLDDLIQETGPQEIALIGNTLMVKPVEDKG